MESLRNTFLPDPHHRREAPQQGHAFQRLSNPHGLEEMGSLDEDEGNMVHQRMEDPRWSIDRGAGFYQRERLTHKRPALVESGRHAGRSRVKLAGVSWRRVLYHTVTRDFFSTVVNVKLMYLLAVLFAFYGFTLFCWANIYFGMHWVQPTCFTGFDPGANYTSALMFAIETQQTIGYGARAPAACLPLALMVATHSILAILLDSIILGIVFARLSHPKGRGRTILISDCACIARRDGVLKFMFRIADIQRRSVLQPRVRLYCFAWGEGRTTAEGEHLPVLTQRLAIDSCDATLLLPLTVEHTVDERSPLFGQSQKSLTARNVELVVVFEGCTELGDNFNVRQSYLPAEVHWGHTFVRIIHPAPPGETQHVVDIARFHDVEPQPAVAMLHPRRAERRVLMQDAHSVPGRVMGENSLVLSDECCVATREGRHFFMVRLGDTCPGQMVNVTHTALLYRWNAGLTSEGEALQYDVEEILLKPARALLRFPVVLTHEITPASPLAGWVTQEGLRKDLDAEIVVSCQALLYSTGETRVRTRVYPVLGCVKWNHTYAPVVTQCKSGMRSGATIDWHNFHTTMPGNTLASSRFPSTCDLLSAGHPPLPATHSEPPPAPSAAPPRAPSPPRSRLGLLSSAGLPPLPVRSTCNAGGSGGGGGSGCGGSGSAGGFPEDGAAGGTGSSQPQVMLNPYPQQQPQWAAGAAAGALATTHSTPFALAQQKAREEARDERLIGTSTTLPPPSSRGGLHFPPHGGPATLHGGGGGDNSSSGHSSVQDTATRSLMAGSAMPASPPTWRDKRSLFAALEAMQAEEMQQRRDGRGSDPSGDSAV